MAAQTNYNKTIQSTHKKNSTENKIFGLVSFLQSCPVVLVDAGGIDFIITFVAVPRLLPVVGERALGRVVFGAVFVVLYGGVALRCSYGGGLLLRWRATYLRALSKLFCYLY